jgi:hypothetical protein
MPKQFPEQEKTVPASIREIVCEVWFARGYRDAQLGRPYNRDYDLLNSDDQWSYERGRALAIACPDLGPFHNRKGGIRREVFTACRRAFAEGKMC